MSDWQPGDLALCIAPHRHSDGHPSVRPGGIYTVEAVGHWFEPALLLKGLPSRHVSRCHAACRFHRIPPHEADAEDRETIRLLNGVPVDA